MSVEADIKKILVAGIKSVVSQSHFQEWIADERAIKDGNIGINNSFLFREVLKTRKNPKYLCVPIGVDGKPACERSCLASNIKFNSTFTHLSTKHKTVAYEKADFAISEALNCFGKIPFILIGTITDNVKSEAKIDHDLFERMILDPSQNQLIAIDGKLVTIRDAYDEETIWNDLEAAASSANVAEPPLPLDLQQPFVKALEQLRAESHAIVTLPDAHMGQPTTGLLDDIIKVLDSQIGEYSTSLSKCKDPQGNSEEFNNVLRISYNFSSDAAKILQLLISLCDLKPILFWCTVGQWFALSEAFQKLPWSKLTTKPSLTAYQSMIGGARNRNFHNLFPFSKTLKVPLGGVPLGAISLTFFSEYGNRKNSNRFEYQDQALIEAFSEFTRAGQKFVPFSFWHKNLDVLVKTVELLRASGIALRSIAEHK